MKSFEPRSVLLTQRPITGITRIDCLSMVAGPMPRRRSGFLRMGLYRDANLSQEFLCVRIERLAWPSDEAQVLETEVHVCFAVSLDQRLEDRDDYLKHCIEMLGQRLHCGNGLQLLAPAISAMNRGWDLLAVFQALEHLPKEDLIDY